MIDSLRKDQFFFPYSRGHAVQRAGASRPIYVLRTSRDAIDVVRQIACNRGSRVRIGREVFQNV